jgi:hypothetical protein
VRATGSQRLAAPPRHRGAVLALATWLVGSCAPTPPGVLIKFENWDAAADGTVTVHVDGSDWAWRPHNPRDSLRLDVRPRNHDFVLVIIIDFGDASAPLVCSIKVAAHEKAVVVNLGSCSPPDVDGGPDRRPDGNEDADTDTMFDHPDGGIDGDGDAGDAEPEVAPDRPEAGPTAPCHLYCREVIEACPEAYLTEDDCRAVCAGLAWPAGNPTAVDGNTIECRRTYAAMALQASPADRSRLCRSAGVSGGHRCDRLCINYCAAARAVCPDLVHSTNCEILDCLSLGLDAVDAGASPVGNTLDCRIYWIGRAAADANLCNNAAPSPPLDSPCNPI